MSINPVQIAIILALIGCKPIPREGIDTEVKTVDNFASGSKVKSQTCGPSSPSDIAELNRVVSGPDEKLRFAAIQSLAAVPAKLRGALFGEKLRGKVNIVEREEVKLQCKLNKRQNNFVNENGAAIDFCWTKEPRGPLRLWVVADQAIIRHGLLRLAAYVYVQLIEEGVSGGSVPSNEGIAIHSALKAARSDISSAFLKEVNNSRKYAPSSSRLQGSHRQNATAFDNELFVEMVDSVYCSPDSEKDFRREFSNTFDHFVGRAGNTPINFTAILGRPWHAQ